MCLPPVLQGQHACTAKDHTSRMHATRHHERPPAQRMHAPHACTSTDDGVRACACALQFAAVKDACCGYMRECLDEGTAAATLSLAARFSCDEVLAHTAAHVSARFHAMRPDALRECALHLFASILERDDLSLHSELQVNSSANK